VSSSYSGSQENISDFTPPLSQTTQASQDSQTWEDIEPVNKSKGKNKKERKDKSLLAKLLKEIADTPQCEGKKDGKIFCRANKNLFTKLTLTTVTDMSCIIQKLGQQQEMLHKIAETNHIIVEQFQLLIESEKTKVEERKQTQENIIKNLEQFKKEVIATTQKTISEVNEFYPLLKVSTDTYFLTDSAGVAKNICKRRIRKKCYGV